MKKCIRGNAAKAGSKNHGWFVGHFMADPMLRREAVEIKWDYVPAGKSNGSLESNLASSVTILVRGKLRFILQEEEREREEFVLENEGDYVLWGRRIYHFWEALEDCLTITIRWPSLPNNVLSKEFKDEDKNPDGQRSTESGDPV